MATTSGQRLGIWIMAAVMLIGTVGGFIAMMVAPSNEAKDQAALTAEQQKYTQEIEAWNKQVAAQGVELSKTYYPEFSQYAGRPAAFDASTAAELKSVDIKVGYGKEITGETVFAAYYIGWNPKGEVFDQSIEADALKAPFRINGLAKTGVIEGWKEGLIGMKIGGVRELTIPSAKAYGEAGSGDKIPPNSPLKFIVMAISPPEEISQPEPSEALKKEYEKYGVGA